MSGIGPGRKPGYHVELAEEAADDLIGVSFATQPVELGHDLHQRLFDVADGALRVELALLLEAPLTLEEFFSIETRERMEYRFARRARIGQEA